jgi:hypothetical protein
MTPPHGDPLLALAILTFWACVIIIFAYMLIRLPHTNAETY